jgi:hypothetical protein
MLFSSPQACCLIASALLALLAAPCLSQPADGAPVDASDVDALLESIADKFSATASSTAGKTKAAADYTAGSTPQPSPALTPAPAAGPQPAAASTAAAAPAASPAPAASTPATSTPMASGFSPALTAENTKATISKSGWGKECPAGCEKNGNCNIEEGRCAAEAGWLGWPKEGPRIAAP